MKLEPLLTNVGCPNTPSFILIVNNTSSMLFGSVIAIVGVVAPYPEPGSVILTSNNLPFATPERPFVVAPILAFNIFVVVPDPVVYSIATNFGFLLSLPNAIPSSPAVYVSDNVYPPAGQ